MAFLIFFHMQLEILPVLPTPKVFIIHRLRILGFHLAACELHSLFSLTLLHLSLPNLQRFKQVNSLPVLRGKMWAFKSKAMLKRRIFVFADNGRIHNKKIVVFLGSRVNLPFKALEHITSSIHSHTDLNTIASPISRRKGKLMHLAKEMQYILKCMSIQQ